MTEKRLCRTAVVLLVLAAVFAAATAFMVHGLLAEYGTTSGSWREGASDGFAFGGAALLVPVVLVVAAVFGSGRSGRALALGSAVVALGVGGVLAGGAVAAVQKYDRLPAVPDCFPEEAIGGPAEPMLRDVQAALAELDHPDRFSGGGSSGIDGCRTDLLNVSLREAVVHYRAAVPEAGWTVTRDDAAGLRARRDGLVLVVRQARWSEDTVRLSVRPEEPVALPPE